jgi:hypothetical protein
MGHLQRRQYTSKSNSTPLFLKNGIIRESEKNQRLTIPKAQIAGTSFLDFFAGKEPKSYTRVSLVRLAKVADSLFSLDR